MAIHKKSVPEVTGTDMYEKDKWLMLMSSYDYFYQASNLYPMPQTVFM